MFEIFIDIYNKDRPHIMTSSFNTLFQSQRKWYCLASARFCFDSSGRVHIHDTVKWQANTFSYQLRILIVHTTDQSLFLALISFVLTNEMLWNDICTVCISFNHKVSKLVCIVTDTWHATYLLFSLLLSHYSYAHSSSIIWILFLLITGYYHH